MSDHDDDFDLVDAAAIGMIIGCMDEAKKTTGIARAGWVAKARGYLDAYDGDGLDDAYKAQLVALERQLLEDGVEPPPTPAELYEIFLAGAAEGRTSAELLELRNDIKQVDPKAPEIKQANEILRKVSAEERRRIAEARRAEEEGGADSAS